MSDWNPELMSALQEDGEKLRALTGEDHGPVFLADASPQEIAGPELDAAIRVAHKETVRELPMALLGVARIYGETFGINLLRSLATPTPEVIEAMAAGIVGVGWDALPARARESMRAEASRAHAALWAHILGETKPAHLQPDLSTRGNRP